ncbi:MAG: hypothetical protein ACM3JE_03725 [Betaproteobacteria bacterium]
MTADENFETLIVWSILNGKTQDALELLSKYFQVDVPKLKVGLPKKHKTKACGCYDPKKQTITLLNSDMLVNPFVVLHEFYHHLRCKGVDRVHKGTEGNADRFALEFIKKFQETAKKVEASNQ